MSKFTLEQLTEDIRSRHMGETGNRLTEKWNRTGLLRGLEGPHRENMAMLLENQAAQLLREQNSLSTGGGVCQHQMTFVVSQILHSQSFAVYSVD